MLPKKQKINKQLFDEVFKKGKTFHSNFFYLKTLLLPNKNEKSKFAFVIPKKISKKAVTRNLIKRKCFAVLKKNKENIIKDSSNILFSKKDIEKLSFDSYEDEIIILLKKAKLLKN